VTDVPEPPHNDFRADQPGTADRTAAEGAIERLRLEGGVFVEAVRATRMPMAITDPALPGNPIVFANDAFLALSGYSMDEVLGQQPHFMNGAGTDPEDARRFREALEQDRDVVLESAQYRKDGSRFLASVLLSAFKGPDGGTLHQFLSYQDMTARETAEARLAEAVLREAAAADREAQLRFLVGVQAMWEADAHGVVVTDSPSWRAYTGQTRDDWLGYGWLNAVHPDDRAYAERQWREAVAAREIVDAEFRLSAPSGGWRWTNVRAVPVFDADGNVSKWASTNLDIDARKRAEIALRESEERLSLAVEVGGLATWDWDLATGNVTWNDRHFLAQGYEVGEVPPSFEAWLARVHPDDRETAVGLTEAARDHGGVYAHEFRMLLPDGTVRWASARGHFFRDATGVPYRMIGVMEDVTERRRSEAHQRMLLEELQHRVRNTLSVVRSIARRTAATSETVEGLAAHLDGRLTAFSRTQAAVTRDPTSGVDLAEIVSAELEAHAAREGHAVTLEGPPVTLKPKAAEVFGLAVHELATNAVKYGVLGAEGGRLAVSWSATEDMLTFAWDERSSAETAPPSRRGVGTELLENLVAYELAAKTSLDFRRDGVRYQAVIPLDRLTR
jgi:PAS domain S-box-containing protein